MEALAARTAKFVTFKVLIALMSNMFPAAPPKAAANNVDKDFNEEAAGCEGALVGCFVGAAVGARVGCFVGAEVGERQQL